MIDWLIGSLLYNDMRIILQLGSLLNRKMQELQMESFMIEIYSSTTGQIKKKKVWYGDRRGGQRRGGGSGQQRH